MVKVKDIVSYFENICPFSLCEEWDNVGLLIGNEENEVKKILVCLDVDKYVAEEAAKCGANLIISHHPVIFHPMKKITKQDESAVITLIKNDISVFSAHTNLDVANGGLNDYLAKKLGLKNTEILVPTGEYNQKTVGYGRTASFENPISFGEIIKSTAKILRAQNLRYVGDTERMIGKIAVNSGGGASMADACFEKGVDLYITGDFKYSSARDCAEKGLCIIDAGHYETEIIACEWFAEKLNEKFDLEVIKSEKNVNVIKYLR